MGKNFNKNILKLNSNLHILPSKQKNFTTFQLGD